MSTKKTTVRLPAKRSGPDPTLGLTSYVGIRATTNTQKKEEATNNAEELDGCFQLFGTKNMHTHTHAYTHTHIYIYNNTTTPNVQPVIRHMDNGSVV